MSTPHETPPHLRRPKLSDYGNGFILAVILTVMPFAMVAFGDMKRIPAMIIISILAVLQMGVHLRYFLHYSTHRTPIEARLALGLALLIGTILIGGCMWVMFDLSNRMMP